VLLVGAGAIATATTDVAVASDRRAHERKLAAARAEHRLETRYLHDVGAIAGAVYNVVQPYHQVLDALAADPTTIFSARDAFAGPDSARELARLATRLHAVSVPPVMRTHQAALEKALTSYAADLGAVRGKASVVSPDKLYDAISDAFTSQLDGDDIDWQLALQDTFAVRLDGPPKTPYSGDDAPPSTVMWVFRADHSCAVGLRRAEPALVRIRGRAAAPGDLAAVGHTLLDTTARLRRVPLPSAQAPQLRDQIVNRLRVADAAGQALVDVSHAARAHSEASGLEALRRFMAAGREVRPLVRGFTSRHVIACENLFAEFAAPRATPRPGSVNA
jgi:hypothetical protein